MATITFDTLKYVKTLKAAGFSESQAEGLAEVQAYVFEKDLEALATKRDLKDMGVGIEVRFDRELTPIRTDLAVIKWMLGILMAGVLALILKSFFPH
ncbi:MAG: DUF1640 domain-containing protein [Magnetococcales bacterium]|nr:DUF1640 domain-containing protein [Magnetococcales bacterium]